MNTSRSKRRRVPFQTQMSPECYTPKHLPPPGAMGEWEVPSLKCFDNNMHKSTMANREPAMLEEDHQGKALHINGDDSDSSGSASTELSSIFSWRHNEFERAASLRVHGLFDELEEQLFEGKAGNLSDELRKECMQWTDHFPHLRVRGQQLTEKSPDNLKSSPPPSVVSAMTVSPSEPAEQSDTYQWQDSEHVTEGAEAACNSHPDGNLIPDSQTAHIKQQVIDILFDELWQGLLEVRGGLGETLGVFMRALMTEAHGTEFRLEQRSRPHGEQPPMKNLSPQSLCFTDVQSHHSQRAGESGISLKQIDRDCKQPSLTRTGLSHLLILMLTQPGNSSTETCSLSCTDSSHLVLIDPTLLPAHGTLNLVLRQLL
uniref:uncharacterized protein isoform X2 n=1 Tax=Myxine glutinosa TaxID=7769 RepID=UPI00359017AB